METKEYFHLKEAYIVRKRPFFRRYLNFVPYKTTKIVRRIIVEITSIPAILNICFSTIVNTSHFHTIRISTSTHIINYVFYNTKMFFSFYCNNTRILGILCFTSCMLAL